RHLTSAQIGNMIRTAGQTGASMSNIRGILWLAIIVSSLSSGPAQTIPDQIDTILARSAVAGNTWTILVENKDGSVIYYQRNPTTGQAPASNTKIFTTSAAFGLLG